ncbi:hypothetical protein KVV02_001377, partial [Mortierella alpina]
MHMAQYGTPFEQPTGLQQHLSDSVNPTASTTAIPSWSPSPTPTMYQGQHRSHGRPLPLCVSSQHISIERELQPYYLQQPLQQPQQHMGLDSQMQSQFNYPAQPFSNVRSASGYRTMQLSGRTDHAQSMKDPFGAHSSLGSETSLQRAASLEGCRPHGLAFQGDHTSAQASEAPLEYRMNWNQIQAAFGSSPNSGACSYSTVSLQMHSSSPTSSGLAYDSSTSFTGAADTTSEPKAQRR